MTVVWTPRIGFGGKLEVDWGAGFVEIGAVVDVSFPIDVGEAETSHQQGPTQDESNPVAYMEAIASKCSGEVSFNVRFDPGATEHEPVILEHIAEIGSFKYTFDDDKGSGNSVWTFDGFYRSINPSAPLEEASGADITIRITGAVTFTGTNQS